MQRRPGLILWALTGALGGCGIDPGTNPSFAISIDEARAILEQMRDDPKPLERPVVVVGGIHDPGIVAPGLAGRIRRVCERQDPVASVSFFSLGTGTFDGCREHLIKSVDRAFGTVSPLETVEVDVIGFSMGGLVARHAARPRTDGGKRLVIRRLFTISTPHRGARLATLPTLDRRAIDMRAGSAFLAVLDHNLADADYDLFTYTRLGDFIVGARNAAPPGQNPWWVSKPPMSLAHGGASRDPRILADIARRLRGERPLAARPAAPLTPADQQSVISRVRRDPAHVKNGGGG